MTDNPDEDTVDLVVAGGGGGLVAAIRAAQHGLSVLVIDASEHFLSANNTAMSTAMIPGAGSRWQSEAGIADSADTFYADIVAKTKGQADENLARALAEVSGPLVEWLADEVGLPMSLVTDFPYPGHSQLRCHTVPGRAGAVLLKHLAEAAQSSPRIDFFVPARLIDVIMTDGTVSAVVVDTPAGLETIHTRAVLLATNGFGADAELVGRYLPEIAGAVYYGSDESTGTALQIGARLGAATAYLDAYQGHAALAMPSATLAGWATVMHGGFLVNEAGARFGNETSGYSEYAQESLRHANGRAWIILDRRIHEACLSFQDYQDTVNLNGIRWATAAAELAELVNIDSAGLTQTLAETREYAAARAADAFGRTLWEAPLNGELAAIFVQPALFHTQGGLRVDGQGRVLRDTGDAITGLYASGGAAMGISGHGAAGYLAGNGLLPALGLAYLAAEHLHANAGNVS
ncbi:FAD-binding protein [Cryobacterium levicorallinum]|uniref:FAD-binding protein n=1 Tax=Cryobacterium levicorallinum TaxID=995038 RepID=A0A1I3E5K0_9MICO|nr:FAD-binding protein [Cryobacterium levicorallinum]TFB82426.1 FAD-binding protein [Cryobacterium levicorallinum]GEP28573.1 fumarate reductase flavoprotein subunit [Cryobacterium levicorallinum]SFH94225.1 fumarate reductase flavoprotein subunit [Cryobacterium levicorallinum]